MDNFESTCTQEEKAYCAFLLPLLSRRNREYKCKDRHKEKEIFIPHSAFSSAVRLSSLHRDTVSFTEMEISGCVCYLSSC